MGPRRIFGQMFLLGLLAAPAAPAAAQEGYTPTPENLASRAWFRQARFGLFIHFGVYSQLGAGEWVLKNRNIPIPEYEWLGSQFNPVRFDADSICGLARRAGMKYVTITSRHHDGFALFATKASTWNIMDRTPFRRDIIGEMATACRRQGLRLFVYYSQLDWRDPDYPADGTARTIVGRAAPTGRFDRYVAFMNAQLTELFSNYGALGGVWFDGEWDQPDRDWHLDGTYALIHRLQPAALIVSNHHSAPHPGEDVQTFEQDLPGANTAGFNTTTVSSLPLETAATMNNSWGYNAADTSFKSAADIIRLLVGAAGRDANLLLNVGPRPDGTIQPQFATRLDSVGSWLTRFGRAIYGTRGGPVAPREWGVTTRRGDTVFVHVLAWQDPLLALPALPKPVKAARDMATGRPLRVTATAGGTTIEVPPAERDSPDRIAELFLQ